MSDSSLALSLDASLKPPSILSKSVWTASHLPNFIVTSNFLFFFSPHRSPGIENAAIITNNRTVPRDSRRCQKDLQPRRSFRLLPWLHPQFVGHYPVRRHRPSRLRGYSFVYSTHLNFEWHWNVDLYYRRLKNVGSEITLIRKNPAC